MLLEFSDAVPPLPAELAGHEGMEQVPECQTPFFLKAEVQPDQTVRTWFDCPPEAPTTRAFAGILAEGLDGATADEISGRARRPVRRGWGSAQAISPLRVRGGTRHPGPAQAPGAGTDRLAPGVVTSVEIEVWADVVCPWCYIGKRRLERALQGYGGEVTVRYRRVPARPDAGPNGRCR